MADAEAIALVKDAEKAEHKKNMFFQKSPDWEKAADCYQRAAQIYRSPAVKKTDAAVYAFDKASACHAQCGAKFFAGVALENAANVLRDAKSQKQAAAKFVEASQMYLLGENVEKCAESLIKAAKAQVEVDADAAIQNYLDVITLYEENEKHIYIADTWRAVLGLLLRQERHADAVQLLLRMFPTFRLLGQEDYLYKAQLSMIVVQLATGDTAAANSSIDKFEGLVDCPEGRAAMELVEKFEEGDFERVAELTKEQTFTLLENQVARTARSLSEKCKEIAGDMTGAFESAPRPVMDDYVPHKPSTAAQQATADDDDDMDDLL